MKKQLLSIFSLGLSIIAIAQPVLTSTNTNPVIGNVFTLKAGSYINQGNPGASQTWNFTSVTQSTAAAQATTVSAVSASLVSQFPSANQQHKGSAGQSGFYNNSSTASQNYGAQTGTVIIKYSNPEDQLRYPISLGTASYTDPFAGTFTSAGYNYFRYGNTTVEADAYGTIQLPSGTYSNVLRVHFVQIYKDSTELAPGFDYIIEYDNDMYMWYLPNNHTPIFSTYSLTAIFDGGSPQTVTGSNTLQSIVNGISELQSSIKSLNFYPNPTTSNVLNLDLNLTDKINYQIIITDNLGREILKTSENNGFEGYNFKTIDVSSIENGLYNFEIISNNQKLVSKTIVISK